MEEEEKFDESLPASPTTNLTINTSTPVELIETQTTIDSDNAAPDVAIEIEAETETAIEMEAETETAIETEAVEESAVAIESAATGAPEQTQTRKRTRNATINTGASDKSTLPLWRSKRIKQKRMLKDSSNVEKEATLHILIIIGHQGEAQQEFEVHRCALLINTMCTTPSRCASVEVDMHH